MLTSAATTASRVPLRSVSLPAAHLRLQRADKALPEAAAQVQQRLLAALGLQPPHHL